MVGSTVYVYTPDATRVAMFTTSGYALAGGDGEWAWNYERGGGFDLYHWTLTAPTKTSLGGSGPGILYSRHGALAFVGGYPEALVDILHLGPSGPTAIGIDIPVGYLSAFAFDAAGHWTVGSSYGVLYDDVTLATTSPRSFGCGAIFNMGSALDGTTALATAGSGILLLNLGATPPTVRGRIAFDSGHVELTDDASQLVAMATDAYYQYVPDRSLNVYDLATSTLVHSMSYELDTSFVLPDLFEFALARGGTRVSRVTKDGGDSYHRLVTDLMETETDYSDSPTGSTSLPVNPVVLSPNGVYAAIPDKVTSGVFGELSSTTTNIYRTGVLNGAIPGRAVTWLDDSRLLVQTFTETPSGFPKVFGSTVCDPTGAPTASVTLPPLQPNRVYRASPNELFAPDLGAIYDVATGAMTWSGALADSGTVVGSNVVLLPRAGHFVEMVAR
jgi:hypothetical protein